MEESEDIAWKIYGLSTDWIGKADSKAAFSLTIESGATAGVIALSQEGRSLGGLGGWQEAVYLAGVVALGLALVLAVGAVIPRLSSRQTRNPAAHQFIFFGHVRHWTPGQVQEALSEIERGTLLMSLSEQVVAVSRVAWRKHRLIQLSLSIASIGMGAFGVVGFG